VVAAVILVWNPKEANRWDYRAAVGQAAESGRFLRRWSVDQAPNVRGGTEAWLFATAGSDAGTGLIGHGTVMSEPYQAVDGDEGAPSWHVSVAFDALLPLGEQVRADTLRSAVPGIRWGDAIGGTTILVPPEAEPGLRRLWRDVGPVPAGSAEVVPGTYPPDAVSTISVNRYERNNDARRVCLAFHGTSCAVCGFSFEASYGHAGTEAIDVHHVVPPGMLGNGYQLDPVADLIPLCPNCHAMAHHGVSQPRTVSELRSIIAVSGHFRGEVVSSLALEAQADARRILESGHDRRAGST
jgi:5-methylcytosine-specific restriction protein A